MTKLAMRDSWASGHVPHLQVHDELDYSVESEAQSKEIQELMINCVDLVVPLKVDVEYGKNWGSIQ
jgi:DNA polymerase I-like protein with 3'-5' exonuclease and polymerase domains